MDFLNRYFIEPLALWDRLLIGLSILIASLFILAILFLIYAFFLRFANYLKHKYWTSLETKWDGIILEILAGAVPPDNLIEKIRRRERRYFIEYLLRYARRLRGEEIEILVQLAKPFLPVIVKGLRSKISERRAQAIQIISVLGIRDYDSDIIAMLDDRSPLVAMVAARTLARKEHPEYVRHVLGRFHRFENWSPAYLSSMLVAVGPEITPDLRNVLTESSKPNHDRRIAADALCELNDFHAADIAVSVLSEECDRELLAAGLRLLARLGRPDHLDSIRPLTESSDELIRGLAVRSLGELGELEDRPRMWEMVFDSSPWVALQAARALKSSGGGDRLKTLTQSEHKHSVIAQQVLAEDGP